MSKMDFPSYKLQDNPLPNPPPAAAVEMVTGPDIQDMDARGLQCSKCRQKLPKTTTGSSNPCPGCLKLSPDRSSNGRICSTRKLAHKLLDKLNGEHGDPKSDQYESFLNSKLTLPERSPKISSFLEGTQRTRKRALLIGVTYAQWKYRLKGTLNDVKRIRDWLIEQHNYPVDSIRVLTEDDRAADRSPTKKNIQESLKWLVEGCREGDSLVFYFSGHGVRQPDFEGDESDGFDETICPVDFLKEGVISDNEINSTIVRPLPQGVTLHSFVDACHSGTILDLVYVYNREKKTWEDDSPKSGTRKSTNGGLAISISACGDDQVAADTSVRKIIPIPSSGNGNDMSGAMTFMLIEIAKAFPGLSYGDLLDFLYELLDIANTSGSSLTKFLRRLFHQRLLQKPLLSASQKFDVYERSFEL